MKSKEKYIYGSVLLLEPEQSEEYLRRACEKMRELSMNTVVVWPPVFYIDGKRNYEIQQNFLEIADEYDLDTVVELTGQVANLEYFPDSLYDDEYAVIDSDGSVARMQNGLGEMNYNHPEVKSALREFFTDTVNALKDYPALKGWDMWNETHFKSYDNWTMKEFQKWLKNKYTKIASLNSLWKKSYTAFEQVRFDPVTWASIMPDCDWEEFRTDNLAGIAAEWTACIKKIDTKHPVIADNVMSNAVWSEFDRGTDDWKLAKSADRYGISFYPKTGGRLLPDNSAWLRSLTFAGAASAGKGSFVISEMQSHYYSEIFTTERVSPEDIIQWNIEALEQGCAGNIYWKWAPFKTGFQLGGRGLALADGSLSKRAGAAGKLGRLFAEHPELSQLRPYSKAAVLYDRWNNFTVKAINNRVKHIIGDDQPLKARYGLYRMCWERNIPLSILPKENLEDELSKHSVLFMPYQVALDEKTCELLIEYTKAGGTLITNYPCVDIDCDGRLYERLPGGPLNDLFGATHLDNLVVDNVELQELSLEPEAEILSELEGCPLVFRRKAGAGQVIYASSAVWNQANEGDETHSGLILDILEREIKELSPVKSNVHAALCSAPKSDYLFIGNYEGKNECRVSLNKKYSRAEMIYGKGSMKFKEKTLDFTKASMAIVKLMK